MKHIEELKMDCRCAKCKERNRRHLTEAMFFALLTAPIGFAFLTKSALVEFAVVLTTLYLMGLMMFAFRDNFTNGIKF